MRKTLTAICALLTLASMGISGVLAEPPLTPSSLRPCPFTPAEIEAALGVSVEEGQVADMTWPGGRDVGCLYVVKGSETVLSVRQTWDPGKAAQAAVTKTGADGKPSVELTYGRGNVRTRVLLHGGAFDEADMQPKILKLKKVP